jgi:hypothetical protein
MASFKGFGRNRNSGIRLKRLSKTMEVCVRIVNNVDESQTEAWRVPATLTCSATDTSVTHKYDPRSEYFK